MMESAFTDEAAFIPYLAAGDPGDRASTPDVERAKELTAAYVEALVAGGADIVELGLPFSEPIADGPTIQQATVRALEAGMTPEHFFDLTRSLSVDVPLVVMTYYNLIYQYGDRPGVEPFVQAAAEANIDGIIVPDLPVEESEPLREACEAAGVALIFVVAPTTREDRLRQIMETVSGYVYVQARLGTTGSRSEVSDHTGGSLERIRRFEAEAGRDPLPKAVGFGISTGEQAEEIVAAGADGVIVGSALIDVITDGPPDVEAVATRLERKAREFKDGAMAGYRRRTQRPERT